MKYTYITFFLLLILTSCFKEESEIIQQGESGDIVLANVEAFSTVFVADDLPNSYTDFLVNVTGSFKELKVNVLHVRTNKKGVIETFTAAPTDTLKYLVPKIIDAIDNLTMDSLNTLDQFYFSISIVSNGGIEASTDSSSFKTIIACPSAIGGTYTVSATGSSTDPLPAEQGNSPISDYAYEVTLTQINGFQYTISDFSGGLFELWYTDYGVSGDSPGTISDLCGSLSYSATTGPFGSPIEGGGSIDPATGVIKISGEAVLWGDKWTLILTPKP